MACVKIYHPKWIVILFLYHIILLLLLLFNYWNMSHTSINSNSRIYLKEDNLHHSEHKLISELWATARSSYWKGQTMRNGWRDGITEREAMDKLAYQLMEYKPPAYTDSKAPCFYVQSSVSKATSLRCLPSVFLIGVSKSGTTDLYTYLTLHRHVVGSSLKEPAFWCTSSPTFAAQLTFGEYIRKYNQLAMLTDHCFLIPNKRLCRTTHRNRFLNATELLQTSSDGVRSPLVSVDASSIYMHHTVYWQDDPLNKGSEELLIFTPHRIKHLLPHAKLVLILRNPVDRLVSDFFFFVEGKEKLNSDYFHTLVVNGIQWWKSCTSILNESKCAFGVNFTDAGLADLAPGTFSWGDLQNQGNNGAGRLRVGLYVIYIQKWLEVFEKKNLFILQMESYSQNVTHALEHDLLPFLELDPYLKGEWDIINKMQKAEPLNKNKRKQQVYQKTRKLLEDFYRPYNVRLSKLLRQESFKWR